jgi:hypothetical protein
MTDMATWRRENPEKAQALNKANAERRKAKMAANQEFKAHADVMRKANLERNKEKIAARDKARHIEHPEIRQAQARVTQAIRQGTLVRPDKCERCGATGLAIEASHDDYDQPLEVEWLCVSCHRTKDKPSWWR